MRDSTKQQEQETVEEVTFSRVEAEPETGLTREEVIDLHSGRDYWKCVLLPMQIITRWNLPPNR